MRAPEAAPEEAPEEATPQEDTSGALTSDSFLPLTLREWREEDGIRRIVTLAREWVSETGTRHVLIPVQSRNRFQVLLQELDPWGTPYWVEEGPASEEDLCDLILTLYSERATLQAKCEKLEGRPQNPIHTSKKTELLEIVPEPDVAQIQDVALIQEEI